MAVSAWLLVAVYYFYQYALRSAPSVMMPQLSKAFGLDSLGMASIVGMFYYAYSPFSLVAGPAVDRFGAKKVIPIGAALVGAGALLFGSGNVLAANVSRFMQGAGGVFALVGAVYLIGKNFPPASAASLVGVTQMFGMAGGSAGQFCVGPLIRGGLEWSRFWILAGLLGLAISVALAVFLPKQQRDSVSVGGGIGALLAGLKRVFSNPQSLLCGVISGLFFIPTTILAMTWGVRFLEEGRGREYQDAVMLAATVPLGWMAGCPLLGFISDRLGRRKPVILGAGLVLMAVLAWVLFGLPEVFRGAMVGIIMGVASGAAMLPYTIIKEANPPELGGSATGVINFINFTFSALLGPVFGWLLIKVSDGSDKLDLVHYRQGFTPLIFGVGLALLLTCFLKETGPAVRRSQG